MLIIGLAFLVLAGVMAGAYGVAAPLGEAIYRLAPAFLNTFQAGVQRNLAPWLWDDLVLPVLEAPAWAPFAAIGLVLVALSLGRRRRRRTVAAR